MNGAKFARYEAYKYSGIEWLGDVPTSWTLNRHKDVFKFVSDRCMNSSFLKVALENIEGKTGRFISTESEFDGDGIKFKRNDILFGKLRPYLAKVYLADFDGNAIGDIFVYRPKRSITPLFAKYLMLSDRFIDVINGSTAGAKMPRVSSNFIANLPVSTPSISEQTAITTYLDTKTAQIDRQIDLLSQKAAQYGKLKQSLINETVTCGLDKTVAIKYSETEWVTEVPVNWEVRRVKNLFSLVTDMAPNNNNYELLSLYTSIGVRPRKDMEQRGNKASSTDGYWLVKKGDIVVNKLLAWMGAIGLSAYDGVTSPAYDVLRKTSEYVSEEYYAYLFRTEKAQEIFKKSSRGIMDMRLRLYFDKFGGIKIPVPPFEEQTAIANYLDEKTAHIDRIVATINSQIDKLKELRKTLINDIVTGKICVFKPEHRHE